MMENNGYSLSDIAAASGNRNNNGFGGEGGWLIWIVLIFAIFGGWGNGFGGFGGGNGAGQGYATRADINEGFALNGIERGISSIQQGLCDSTYALNNAINGGFNSMGMALCNGFNGVQQGFAATQAQMASCCCETQRAIDGVNFNMAQNTCALQNTMNSNTRDILENNNANTRAVLDFLTQDKIASLQAENQSLKLAASQSNQNAYLTASMDAQTAELIRRINPTPVPAYTVPAPYPYGGCCSSMQGC